jgi:hypothetical protein
MGRLVALRATAVVGALPAEALIVAPAVGATLATLALGIVLVAGIRREQVKRLQAAAPSTAYRFLPALVRRDGYDVAYVDVVDRVRLHGVSNYGMWDRLWVGILDLAGVWWLIRRKRRVPQVSEVSDAR